MASITIRRLPEDTKRRLRIRAAYNGHSMEQEARELLDSEKGDERHARGLPVARREPEAPPPEKPIRDW